MMPVKFSEDAGGRAVCEPCRIDVDGRAEFDRRGGGKSELRLLMLPMAGSRA